MDDLETLRPEVREAWNRIVADEQYPEDFECVEAELLRLADENKRMRGIIETLDIEGHRRAEKAEAKLAALKARIFQRIFQGIVLDVDDLARGHAGLPSEWRGKRVRLVVEE